MGNACSFHSLIRPPAAAMTSAPAGLVAGSASAGENHGVASCSRTVVIKKHENLKHRWVIEGFSALPVQRTVCVTSTPFLAGGHTWELFCHNDGHNEQVRFTPLRRLSITSLSALFAV